MPKPAPLPRSAYHFSKRHTTRWADNDVYGHVNNALYYSFFDTTITAFLVENVMSDPLSDPMFFVVASDCAYFEGFSFPEDIEAGLFVAEVGRSSVTWRIGLFGAGENEPRAQGRFVHVCVDRETKRPMGWPDKWREIFGRIARTESVIPAEA